MIFPAAEPVLSASRALVVVLKIDDVMLFASRDEVMPARLCVQDGCGGECWQGQHLEESSDR